MNQTYESELYKILAEKPEMVMGYPPDSAEEILSASKGEAPVLLEIAGRDSIAAALVTAREGGARVLAPTIVYTGTEFGDWKRVFENVDILRSLLEENRDVSLTPPIVLGSPRCWWALAARFAGRLGSVFGFCTFCLSCHMYLHTVRIPFARKIGARSMVGGERESHGGKVKVNQVRPALEAYQGLCSEFGVELELPLRSVGVDDDVTGLLGHEWPEGERQLECVLAANYRGSDGEVILDEEKVVRFLEDYLVPAARALVKGYLDDPSGIDYEFVVAGYLPQPA